MIFVKKHRIYPSKNQQETINFWFRKCNLLYNASIEERVDYYRVKKKYYSMYDQKKELVDIKKNIPEFKDIPNKSLQEIIIRSDKAFKLFFKRGCKGFPKYSSNLNSIFFAKMDVRIKNNELFLPKIKENITYKEEIIHGWTSVRLIRKNEKYYVDFTYDDENINDIKIDLTYRSFDLGLMNLFVDNEGNKQMRFDIKLYKRYQKRIKELNQSLARKNKNSNRRKRVNNKLSKTHERLFNSKKDFLHKVTTNLIKKTPEYNLIIGDIQIQNIIDKTIKIDKEDKSKIKSNRNLRRSFYNSSLNIFKNMMEYKGLKYNKNVVFVNEAWTSKTCCKCGKVNFNLKLRDRIFRCSCGSCIDRDENSAINIGNVWLGQFNTPVGLNSHDSNRVIKC
jgi:putative transposase